MTSLVTGSVHAFCRTKISIFHHNIHGAIGSVCGMTSRVTSRGNSPIILAHRSSTDQDALQQPSEVGGDTHMIVVRWKQRFFAALQIS